MKRVLITILIILIVTSFIGTGYFLYQKSVEKPVVYQTESPFITNIVKKNRGNRLNCTPKGNRSEVAGARYCREIIRGTGR